MSEIQSSQFYLHNDYVASYYALYIALEQWLSSFIFRQDASRVFLASDNYAFRRRYELTDTSQAYTTLGLTSLRFPFANYDPLDKGWEPDDRIGAHNAAMIFNGVTQGYRLARSMAVKNTIPVTLYFDREDDSRLAHESLLYSSYTPHNTSTAIAWKGENLEIPIQFRVTNLRYNPSLKEEDWLKQNRVFIVKAELETRSVIFTPPKQPIYTNSEYEEDNEKFTLTEEVILQFYNNKKLSTTLTLDALFDQNPAIVIEQCAVAATTPTTVRLAWDVAGDPLTSISVLLQGKEEKVFGPEVTTTTIRNLTPESTYIVIVKFTSVNGTTKTIPLTFTTPIATGATTKKTAKKNTLVGTSW
jgi:hypothetical protein